MDKKYIKISEMIGIMDDFENTLKISCFEKNEKSRKTFFNIDHYSISYENLWNKLRKQLNDKISSHKSGVTK